MVADARTANAALNRLIEICHDGHDGYQTAAHHIADKELKLKLGKFARERKTFREELARKVDRHAGGAPHEHGTMKGALHRGWIDLKARVRDLEPPAILAECLRGEEASVALYEDVLREDLPPELKDLVTHQLGLVVKARNALLELGGGARD